MDDQTINKLAVLARLELQAEERARFAANLAEIIAYVEQLNEVDVADVEPTSQVTGLLNVLREDKRDEARGMRKKELEQMAPEMREGYVVVPSVLSQPDL
ncbi:Asp-tRNA(Asn)/Glu-tRNA(Gln) amidotransferase subunit GatC [Candidatus Berkelbacteria bacterium]|nr:Asp-tRNA(Asn)/Glu-tRNA(Gln) amidotransferase subunit GatC [Candidatus Berkelbacteria bacterium]